MPLPLIIGAAAAAAAAAGVGSGIHGAVKMKEASDTSKAAQARNDSNVKKLESTNKSTMNQMDEVGKCEMEILASFKKFMDTFEKIKNRPDIAEISKDKVTLSNFTPEEVKNAAVGASVLIGGMGGAALGTAGGFAAAGATTAAVMALGTASTGTAIASFSGAAATNATLAALGGGALAAGGGGVALGTAVLGGATLGVGLLVGGIIFNLTGSSLSEKADEAWRMANENEKKINGICSYLEKLKSSAEKFLSQLKKVSEVYDSNFKKLDYFVNVINRDDYNDYAPGEKLIVKNTCTLVALLYKMCKVELVKKSANENEQNSVNSEAIVSSINDAEKVLDSMVA